MIQKKKSSLDSFRKISNVENPCGRVTAKLILKIARFINAPLFGAKVLIILSNILPSLKFARNSNSSP